MLGGHEGKGGFGVADGEGESTSTSAHSSTTRLTPKTGDGPTCASHTGYINRENTVEENVMVARGHAQHTEE